MSVSGSHSKIHVSHNSSRPRAVSSRARRSVDGRDWQRSERQLAEALLGRRRAAAPLPHLALEARRPASDASVIGAVAAIKWVQGIAGPPPPAAPDKQVALEYVGAHGLEGLLTSALEVVRRLCGGTAACARTRGVVSAKMLEAEPRDDAGRRSTRRRCH